MTMDRARLARHAGWWMLLGLAAFWVASPVRAAGDAARDEELRKKALSLNNVTGDDPIKGQIKELAEDKEGTKKLLGVAVAMSKEKPQPFNFNAAYVLARAAQEQD